MHSIILVCLLTVFYVIVSKETTFKFYYDYGCSNMGSFMLISVLLYLSSV
jgi:hypothetical protein